MKTDVNVPSESNMQKKNRKQTYDLLASGKPLKKRAESVPGSGFIIQWHGSVDLYSYLNGTDPQLSVATLTWTSGRGMRDL
jgi:hypothetical protein